MVDEPSSTRPRRSTTCSRSTTLRTMTPQCDSTTARSSSTGEVPFSLERLLGTREVLWLTRACPLPRALKPPGWIPSWHIGVRVKTTKKLVAFISGIPVHLRVRSKCVASLSSPFHALPDSLLHTATSARSRSTSSASTRSSDLSGSHLSSSRRLLGGATSRASSRRSTLPA